MFKWAFPPLSIIIQERNLILTNFLLKKENFKFSLNTEKSFSLYFFTIKLTHNTHDCQKFYHRLSLSLTSAIKKFKSKEIPPSRQQYCYRMEGGFAVGGRPARMENLQISSLSAAPQNSEFRNCVLETLEQFMVEFFLFHSSFLLVYTWTHYTTRREARQCFGHWNEV